MKAASPDDRLLRRTITIVAILNLTYFFVEFAVARKIGSVSLFADSIDFLEDTSVNLLILLALRWSSRGRARMGLLLALVLLVPGIATIWTAFEKVRHPTVASGMPLSLTGLGALATNLSCAWLLARTRYSNQSLTLAAFLSARNDAMANVLIISAGLATAFLWHSIWPDLIAGGIIAALNLDAAKEVWEAAREEHRAAA